MSQNKLKLNADKTEVLVLGTPKQRAKISVPSISVNGEIVKGELKAHIHISLYESNTLIE